MSIFIDKIIFINKSGATSVHRLYIMPFDRSLAALVLIKFMAIFVAIILSNYQKSCFICLSSALVSQSTYVHVMYTGVFQKPQLNIHDSGHDSPRFIPIRARR